ncbi:MBL fold metallo-hydrolase [Phaeobacter inhibens]|uniref:MBL fold metallo-hydrolase n=1 Tax=Phaeobacter inhibens TaxID=221822 RepID=UPI0004233239|nr:MBL fold metallo-hydrolase [Phaeobacter inhibens]
MTVTRRRFVQGLGAGMALLPAGRVWAETRVSLGGAEVLSLSDGQMRLPPSFLYGDLDPAMLAPVLAKHGMTPDDPLTPAINITLLRDADRIVLFDAGAGPGFQDGTGLLPDALAAAGISPEDITHVVFTHCHPDHLWGVLDDFDDPLFANAKHLMGRQEWDYWFDPATVDTIGEDRASMAVGARRRMEILADGITLFDDGVELLPGIAARATFGHSPGHMSFEIARGTDRIMILGDAVTNAHVSFSEPSWEIASDQDPVTAARVRQQLLQQLASEQLLVVGYHLPDGGMGYVEATGGGYRFVPGI